MWVKLLDRSRRGSADLLLQMKKDGLTFHSTNQGAQFVAVTTDNEWLAKKWDMTALAEHEGLRLTPCDIFSQKSFLDRLTNLSALNLIFVLVIAVLIAQVIMSLPKRSGPQERAGDDVGGTRQTNSLIGEGSSKTGVGRP
jgi:hypothetical protein